MLPVFVAGARSAIFYAIGSILLGFCIAVAICAMRLARNPLSRSFAMVYVSAFRGVPLIVQLLITYYCLPLLGVNISPGLSALITLALCTGAYQAEILRGGFMGVSRGQIEAAQMSGLTRWQILLFIETPQAVRLTLPSLTNEAVTMVKASSLISVVGVLELTRAAQNVAASTYRPFAAYLTAGLIYLVMTSLVASAGAWLERRMQAGS